MYETNSVRFCGVQILLDLRLIIARIRRYLGHIFGLLSNDLDVVEALLAQKKLTAYTVSFHNFCSGWLTAVSSQQ